MPKIGNVDAKNPEEAIRAIGTPSDVMDHLFLGEAYFYLGEYQKAADELFQGLNLTSKGTFLTSTCTVKLVTALCCLDQVDRAIEAIDRFQHHLDSIYLPVLQRFQATRQWPAAITSEWMEFVVLIWLDSPVQRRPDLVERLCRALTKLSPMEPKVWFNLGRGCADQRKFDLAITAFSEYLTLRPNTVDALVSRAWCYKLSGKSWECLADVERVRQLSPYDPDLDRLERDLDLTHPLMHQSSGTQHETHESIYARQRYLDQMQVEIFALLGQAWDHWNRARNLWMSAPYDAMEHSSQAILLGVDALHRAQKAKGIPIDPSSVISAFPTSSKEDALRAHRESTDFLNDTVRRIKELGFRPQPDDDL